MLQMQGSYAGTPSIFIRLQGCAIGCPWCNAKQTWAMDDVNRTSFVDVVSKRMDAMFSPEWAWAEPKWIVEYIVKTYKGNHVVITGGEPCQYDLTDVTNLLEGYGYSTQIETSGAYPIQASAFTFVSVSPKISSPSDIKVIDQNVIDADEVTFAADSEEEIEDFAKYLAGLEKPFPVVYLLPTRNMVDHEQMCIEAATEHGWRVSLD